MSKKSKTKHKTRCPNCGFILNVGRMLGQIKSKRKSIASIINGCKGGRPVTKKNGINDTQKKSENKV